MFDKIAFRAKIDTKDIDTIVLREYLEQYTKSDEVYYRSTAYSNLSGVTIDINGDVLKCKCSINKLYYKKKSGKLDNSMPITFGNATNTIRELLMRLCVKPENAVVTYYEVGLTMRMKMQPDAYIRAVKEGAKRVFWNDPNFPEMRQKITEKSKHYRKILKMYDKTFEFEQKGRAVSQNVLRVESIYRHQSVSMVQLLEPSFQIKIGKKFYEDWSGVQFIRRLKPTKGVKMSELAKAQEIYDVGLEAYTEKYRSQWKSGDISRKAWQTFREYGNRWPEEQQRYEAIIGDEEADYKEMLLRFFQIGLITSKS